MEWVANYQLVKRKEADLEQTLNLRKLTGKRVLSEGGSIVGYVSEIRINPKGFELEGIVVERRFEYPIYIGKSYFSTLSNYSVILNTELSILIKGRKVLTINGKKLGRVTQVNRKGTTNEIESIIVSSLFRKYQIPISEIKQMGDSILIKCSYNDSKSYLWKRSRQNADI